VPSYTISASNRETVSSICARLDGMPLAIELAAARLDTLSEEEVLKQLSNRFHLLKAGSRTAPLRQQTMTATIDWSYRLLTEEEALLFRRLSVFHGGFTLESTQAVCGDGIAGSVLDVLSGLVRKSMVVAERDEGSRSRYRLLESQLAYAEERLRESGELDLLRRRHYDYFMESIAVRPFWLVGRRGSVRDLEWADWMTQESANLSTALEWARHNTEDLGLSLAVELAPRNEVQMRSLLTDLLAHSPTQGTVRVKGLVRAAINAVWQGDFEEALQLGERAVTLAREVGDVNWLAAALNRLGMVHRVRGELAAAAELYTEAISLIEGSIHTGQLRWHRNSAANLAIDSGDYLGALTIAAECVAGARAEDDVGFLATFLDSQARAQLGLNDQQAAGVSWREALSISRRFAEVVPIVISLNGLSCVAAASADHPRALRLAAAARRISDELSLHLDPWLDERVRAAEGQTRSRLGMLKSAEAWKEGWAMSPDDAIDYALGESESEASLDAGPLSLRQQEVAKLVAAGLTNREIAKRLFISERTAEGHVEHIRNKLGVRSRTEIATWAIERGLAKTVPRIRRLGRYKR
jgi:DNA-binding CsgD family transcriptional regulator